MQTCRRTLLLAAGAIFAVASTSAQAFPGQDKIQPELLDRMQRGASLDSAKAGRGADKFRVIVSLDRGRFDDRRALGRALNEPSERAALRAHVRAAQKSVIGSLPPKARDNVLARYRIVPGFSGEFTEKHIERLARHPKVTYVEKMPVHHLMDTEADNLTGTDSLKASGYTGQGSVIALIDDGIDHDHAAFGGQSSFPNDKIIGGYDFADYDSDPTIDCTGQSHGTATTGVAVGNGGGVQGAAPDAKALMLKVQASSECGQPSLSGDIVAAIDWIVDNQSTYDIDIISMSLGGGAFASQCDGSSSAYASAVDSAYAAGMVILAASGNEGLCDQISRPACLSNVISVGAVYDADVGSPGYCVSGNSCIGQSHQSCPGSACFDNSTSGDQVTCYSNSASFLDILSPSNCATTAQAGGGTNDCFGGTSSATPYAAGVAAGLIEAAGGSGSLDNDQMRSLLADNGVAVNDPKSGLSKPRVDAVASLNALGSGGGGGGATELVNGTPETGLSGSSGDELDFFMDVPSDASNLSFDMSGGSGDADLYVRFGSEPTTNDWDCRPYQSGNNESCDFASPQTGTYYVMVRGYSSFSGVDLVGSFDTGSGGGGGGAPCTNCDHYTGSLSSSGDSEVEPDGTYYYSGAGTHDGWLEGPSSADFDLELYRWNGSSWSKVDESISSTSSESISYNGTSGYYYWKIVSYSGSGSFDFWLDRP